MGFCSLPRGIVVCTLLTRYQSSHIVAQEGLWWPFIFPVNGIDPQKSCDNAYRNSIHLRFYLCYERRTQLLNEISNSAVRCAFYIQTMIYEGPKRGVLSFCQHTDKGMTTLYT